MSITATPQNSILEAAKRVEATYHVVTAADWFTQDLLERQHVCMARRAHAAQPTDEAVMELDRAQAVRALASLHAAYAQVEVDYVLSIVDGEVSLERKGVFGAIHAHLAERLLLAIQTGKIAGITVDETLGHNEQARVLVSQYERYAGASRA